MASRFGASYGGRFSAPRKTSGAPDLTTIEGLEETAKEAGLEPPKKSKTMSALKGASRVLNVDIAAIAGAVRGLKRKDKTVFQGIREGLQKNIGFSDVLREDYGMNPETRAGKIALGTTGFIADVLFSPITYLTFGLGAGLKIGGKTLTKSGTRLAQKAAQEMTQTGIRKSVSGTINELLQRTIGKRGVRDISPFAAKGISTETLTALKNLGPRLIDEGGIKFFGKTLVSSETLAHTPVGRVARRLGETEIVQAFKNTLGRMFVPDFMKDPRLVSILNKMSIQQRRATIGIVKRNAEVFKGLSDDEMFELFDEVYKKKLSISGEGLSQFKAAEKLTGELKKLKLRRNELLTKRSQMLKDFMTTPQGEELVSRNVGEQFFVDEKLLQGIKNSSIYKKEKTITDEMGEGFLMVKNDKYKIVISKNKDKAVKGGWKVVNEIDSFAHEAGFKSGFDYLNDTLSSAGKRGLNQKQIKEEVEAILKSEGGEYAKLSSDVDELILNIKRLKGEVIPDIEKAGLEQRRLAKSLLREERLTFENAKLQKVADILFEGENAIVPRFAKLAGLSKEDAIKFYIPSKFRDKLFIKGLARGRILPSADPGFLRLFKGVTDENLIKSPFEAYSLGQIQVASAKIKTDTFNALKRTLGKNIDELKPSRAAELGYERVTRTGLREGKVVALEGWFPKEIAKEINKFLEPKENLIDEFAKISGFDYVTGLFKGYVTSIFPGFHIRNLTSNQFQLALKIGLDVTNPALHKRALDIALNKNLEDVLVTKLGHKITNRQLKKMIEAESDVLMEGAFGSVEQMLKAGQDEILKRPGMNPFSLNNILLAGGRKIGTAAEQQAKLVGILSSVMEGKSVREGIKVAEEAIFNYRKLTDFERSVMRRLIPFYTFARKNFELQLKALAHTPGRVAGQIKFIKNLGQAVGEPLTEEDVAGLPDFILQNLGIKAGANRYGQKVFYSGFGLPIEEFLQRFSGKRGILSNVMSNILTQANPILKYPLENITGIDFFRRKPIVEITSSGDLKPLIDAIDLMPKSVAQEFKSLIEWREIPNQPIYAGGEVVGRKTKYTANPFFLHLTRNLFSSRIQSTVGFLTAEEETNFNKFLRLFTGIRGWSIDKETQRFYNELERRQELENWLIRMGIIKKFERTFVPKNK